MAKTHVRKFSEGKAGDLSLRLFHEFNQNKEYKAGEEVKIQIMRTGQWNHASYGKIKVTEDTIDDVIKNFKSNARGIKLAVDENHEPNHKALAWFKDLYKEGKDKLFATLTLTKKGAKILSEGLYQYFSPEIVFYQKDEETGNIFKNLLTGGAFTNRPFFKKMQPLFANESSITQVADPEAKENMNSNSFAFLFNGHENHMKKLIELLAKFSESKKISKSEQEELSQLFKELPEEDQSAELKSHVDEALAFSDTDDTTSDDGSDGNDSDDADKDSKDGDDGSDDDGSDEGDDEDGTDGDDADVDVSEELNVKANEDGKYVFSEENMNRMKEIISAAGKAIAKARRGEIENKIGAFTFSEKTKKGFILPSKTEEVVNFAMSLNEQQSKKFLNILGQFKALSAGEIGHSKTSKKFSSTDDAAKHKFFTEKMLMTEAEAEEAMKNFNDSTNQ